MPVKYINSKRRKAVDATDPTGMPTPAPAPVTQVIKFSKLTTETDWAVMTENITTAKPLKYMFTKPSSTSTRYNLT